MISGVLGIISIWLWGVVVGLHFGAWYEKHLDRKERIKLGRRK